MLLGWERYSTTKFLMISEPWFRTIFFFPFTFLPSSLNLVGTQCASTSLVSLPAITSSPFAKFLHWLFPLIDLLIIQMEHLTQEFYMKQPHRFVNPNKPHYVCYLKKVIYGLKQGPREWFHRYGSFLPSHGFVCGMIDLSMFVYRTGSDTLILLLYVNDIILTRSSNSGLYSFIAIIYKQFAMKDIHDLHYRLGLCVVCSPFSLILMHQKYILDLLHKSQLQTARIPYAKPPYPFMMVIYLQIHLTVGV